MSCDADELLRKAAALKGLADAVNVTDGAGARAHMAALAAASLLIGAGIEPILQITCRDKNRIALQSELMGAAALGIRNLLILTGDDPKAGDQPDTKPVFDVNSKTPDRDRAAAARRGHAAHRPQGRGQGRLLHRRGRHADRPAGRLATQFAARQGQVRRAIRADAVLHGCRRRAPLHRPRSNRRGLTKQLAILIGVNPLRSAKSAAWMKSHLFGTIIPDAFIERMEKAAEPAREGMRICVELIEELSTIPGVAGVHIMAPGNDAAIPEVIAAVRSGHGKPSSH